MSAVQLAGGFTLVREIAEANGVNIQHLAGAAAARSTPSPRTGQTIPSWSPRIWRAASL